MSVYSVRVICWFPPQPDTVVVALFANDKARMGDIFYNTVGLRADPLIDVWKRPKTKAPRLPMNATKDQRQAPAPTRSG